MLVWLLILVPLLVAGAISALLVWRETAAANGSRTRGTTRAAGFGQGGQPTPLEGSPDAGLKTFLEPDYWRPGWLRALRILVLAVLIAAAAAVISVAIYLLGRWTGDAIRNFVNQG